MSSAFPAISQTPDSTFFRWLHFAVPQSLVEVDISASPLNAFSAFLLNEGWHGWLIEPNPALFTHLEHHWKDQHAVTCILRNQVSLSDLLAKAHIPVRFGVLILNSSEGRLGALHDLYSSEFRASIVAIRDEGESADQRAAVYEYLVENGYRFAGVEQVFSLWSHPEVTLLDDQQLMSQATHSPGTILAEAGIACFDTPTSDPSFAAVGHLELAVGGWAFLEVSQPVPPSVYIEATDLLTGQLSYVPAIRYPRLDVSRHFTQPDLLLCGFHATVPMRQFHPHGMLLRVIQCIDGKCYPSPVHLTIERGITAYEAAARQGLAQKYLRGCGIEIGALQRKLELPPACRVRYVDRMAMTHLLDHYPELVGMNLQSPDLVDDGERLLHIAAGSLDFVVANHFFEHSENPIQTLHNLIRVIRPFGILFMAVPDKRYTFDVDRPSTSFESLRETFFSGQRADRPQLYREWVQLVERRSEAEISHRAGVLADSNYSIHFNVWTADELFTFLLRVRDEFAMPFTVASAVCSDNETIILLEKVLESK